MWLIGLQADWLICKWLLNLINFSLDKSTLYEINNICHAYLLISSQVRGFAPIGMLEFWNIGIMGSGIME